MKHRPVVSKVQDMLHMLCRTHSGHTTDEELVMTERTLTPFRNEALTDFNDAEQAAAMRAALAEVEAQLGRTYPLVIGGAEVEAEARLATRNPAHPDVVIGHFATATTEHVEQAIDAAWQAFETWQYVPAHERAAYLFDAASRIREYKHRFSAWMIYEVGKSWSEADADTAELIDFLEYYGRQMLDMARDPHSYVVQLPTEENALVYAPLGVGIVIPPWNFAGAIMGGMSAAAIVTGNTIVLKPSEASAATAWQFIEIMREVGLPPGVINFLPGYGNEIGDALVGHPRTRFISFTGSKAVGLRINELAAKQQPGQIWIKRTVLEMGGKDAVIVDETTDLAAAADGIVVSAFGFQGQKCSAGSRAIIVEEVYDQIIPYIVERAKQLSVGDTTDPSNFMGPIVNEKQFRKILDYIEVGKTEGRLLVGGNALDRPGYFIEPTVFADVAPDARIAQEEIFGPVLALIKARDWEDALRIANSTEYALTGAVYSSDPERIEEAMDEFQVGNLYINRKCTGALVGVHPFGGFNMSGTDSKAGGPDYLRLFTQPKSITRQKGKPPRYFAPSTQGGKDPSEGQNAETAGE
jgi:1-pyrroline-5-carboxylate dehydrogenase